MDFQAYQQALRQRVGVTGLAFTTDEYARRQEAVLGRMASAGLDALLVTDPSDILYLTGYSTFEVSVHTALALSNAGATLQVPSIETGPGVTGSVADRVVGYRWESGRTVVSQLLGELRRLLDTRRPSVGVDPWQPGLRPGVLDDLREQATDWRFEDGSGIVDPVRLVKSDAELDMLRASARVTEAGIEAASRTVRAGATDNDVAAAASQAMLSAGGEFMSMQPIVVAGWRSSVIHTNHQRHRIEAGEPVFMELGAAWNRYTAPMMRTVVAGGASPAMGETFETIRAIRDALSRHMIPGETFDRAAAEAERALAPLAESVFFSGVYGYAVGAQFPPSWVEGTGFIARGEESVFQENMVFHLPLCLRRPGEWGIGCSDTVRVTYSGAVPITRNEWTLPERA
ncbi:aminopeptidase P family protein [Ectothiorhodospiraceae bacterium WFHF3C12]|nr:aminopeptidase P family protein [Ectothiorhodospiraceae bacterium WFHF3C12]